MLQSLLPTRDRLARMGKVQDNNCVHCGEADSTVHLLSCSLSGQVAPRLLQCLTNHVPGITPTDIVLLRFPPLSQSVELPVVWLVISCLTFIWDQRVLGRVANLESCRAELLAKLMLLSDTKWRHSTLHNSVVVLEEMINLHF